MRISGASDSNFARISSDQNLPITENINDASSHGSDAFSRLNLGRNVSYLTKLESLASSAVRSADKVGAKLIIVYTQTGHFYFKMMLTTLLFWRNSLRYTRFWL
jgi:hypothetical protein